MQMRKTNARKLKQLNTLSYRVRRKLGYTILLICRGVRIVSKEEQLVLLIKTSRNNMESQC